MNSLSFTGRLTRDAETRYLQNGTAVLSFSVANNTGYGDKQKTNYFDCALFGKRAEGKLAEYMKKGQEVGVVGELSLNTYQKKDGTQGASLQVRVNDVDLIGSKGSQNEPQQQSAPPMPDDFESTDIPF